MEILVEWSAQDSAETVGRECTRQYRNITKTTFQWLIYEKEIKFLTTDERRKKLPKILDILYSKFCAATKGFSNFLPPLIIA